MLVSLKFKALNSAVINKIWILKEEILLESFLNFYYD